MMLRLPVVNAMPGVGSGGGAASHDSRSQSHNDHVQPHQAKPGIVQRLIVEPAKAVRLDFRALKQLWAHRKLTGVGSTEITDSRNMSQDDSDRVELMNTMKSIGARFRRKAITSLCDLVPGGLVGAGLYAIPNGGSGNLYELIPPAIAGAILSGLAWHALRNQTDWYHPKDWVNLNDTYRGQHIKWTVAASIAEILRTHNDTAETEHQIPIDPKLLAHVGHELNQLDSSELATINGPLAFQTKGDIIAALYQSLVVDGEAAQTGFNKPSITEAIANAQAFHAADPVPPATTETGTLLPAVLSAELSDTIADLHRPDRRHLKDLDDLATAVVMSMREGIDIGYVERSEEENFPFSHLETITDPKAVGEAITAHLDEAIARYSHLKDLSELANQGIPVSIDRRLYHTASEHLTRVATDLPSMTERAARHMTSIAGLHSIHKELPERFKAEWNAALNKAAHEAWLQASSVQKVTNENILPHVDDARLAGVERVIYQILAEGGDSANALVTALRQHDTVSSALPKLAAEHDFPNLFNVTDNVLTRSLGNAIWKPSPSLSYDVASANGPFEQAIQAILDNGGGDYSQNLLRLEIDLLSQIANMTKPESEGP